MIHLDTHVLVWLYSKKPGMISPKCIDILNTEPVAISPMVKLELTYLNEIGRLLDSADTIMADMFQALDIRTDSAPMSAVMSEAQKLSFTRDPFDRIIAAQALCTGSILMTKDVKLTQNLEGHTIW